MIGGLTRRVFASVFVAVLSNLAVSAMPSNRKTRPVAIAPVVPPRDEPETTPASSPVVRPAKRRSRRRRIAVAVLDIALLAAIALTLFVGYGVVGNRWYRVVAIEGGSMEPTITRGDLIVVTPAPKKIEAGMILLMGVDGRMVTHRVVEVRTDGTLVTRGDANETNDDWQGKPIDVYGEYQFTIPALGRYLPISNASGAWLNDGATAAQSIVVGSWPTEAPPSGGTATSPPSGGTATLPPSRFNPVSPAPKPSRSPAPGSSSPPTSSPPPVPSPGSPTPSPTPSPSASDAEPEPTAPSDPPPDPEPSPAPTPPAD